MTYEDIQEVLTQKNFENYVMEGVFYSQTIIDIFQEKTVDVFFLFGYDASTKIIYQPFARIAIDSKEKTLAYYYESDEKPFDITLPEDFISKIPYDETYKEWLDLYGECYCKIREFVFQPNITDEQKIIISDYLQAFDNIIDDELKPFYFELSPEFWEWLKNAC